MQCGHCTLFPPPWTWVHGTHLNSLGSVREWKSLVLCLRLYLYKSDKRRRSETSSQSFQLLLSGVGINLKITCGLHLGWGIEMRKRVDPSQDVPRLGWRAKYHKVVVWVILSGAIERNILISKDYHSRKSKKGLSLQREEEAILRHVNWYKWQ